MPENAGFDLAQLGVWGDEVEFEVTRERVVAYAEATNDPTSQHLDGTYAPPVFAIVPPFQLMAERTMAVVPDELMMRILHGEHDFRFRRPIEPGETIISRARAVGVAGKSSGVTVTTQIECRSNRGDLVNEQFFVGFFRGGKFDGQVGEAPPEHGFDPALSAREPAERVVQKFDEDQTFRYSEASGDPMPIHLDDEFAKQMGLPGIIIHGLCTMAFTSHAVLGHASPADPARLTRLAVRFSAPARPRDTITTAIWPSGAGSYSFQTTKDDGQAVIKDGRAEFAD
ncbi:MaoC/PaaZ C-terminal domain-containing protein [Pseudonocardia eucalypti]|uniref:MaoC/PaaZ C-terminal domain-containing protein n=1 Tax=Pseudonocardia eucalypti TaxID=648755 RepID=A0ABP9PRW0_9PSEU|nr:acyl dehydratase [Pseudonocardia eucalypti]